jgi:hypothetical protein
METKFGLLSCHELVPEDVILIPLFTKSNGFTSLTFSLLPFRQSVNTVYQCG